MSPKMPSTMSTKTVRNLGPVRDYPAHVGETEAAREPLEQANQAAAARYLDSNRTRAASWELTSALMGEDYFRACGLTDVALEAWCRQRLGLPSVALVCPSPSCGGRGAFAAHPLDDGERCAVCRGSGVIPGHTVAVAAFAAEEVARAA